MDLRDIFNIEESGTGSCRGDQSRDNPGRHRLHDRVLERQRHSGGCSTQLCRKTDAYCILSPPPSPVPVRLIFRDSSPRRIIESTERVHLAETDQARASLGPCVPFGTARPTSANVHVVGVSRTWPFSRTQPRRQSMGPRRVFGDRRPNHFVVRHPTLGSRVGLPSTSSGRWKHFALWWPCGLGHTIGKARDQSSE